MILLVRENKLAQPASLITDYGRILKNKMEFIIAKNVKLTVKHAKTKENIVHNVMMGTIFKMELVYQEKKIVYK